VRLEPLRKLRKLDKLSDEDMVNYQRINLLDSTSPNPSVETLLHAFLPHKFIDHVHSTAVLALTDQPDNKALVQEVYGDRVAYVPYTIPGFALAKSVADVFDKNPKVEGLVLLQHGIFTVGDTAEQAYGRMIEFVTMAEERLTRQRKIAGQAKLPSKSGIGAGDRAHPARRGGDREERDGREPPSGRFWISAPIRKS
jgi:rhamnose utilization protein RhaD (predicted bifunctional aldolase and dehydrogenase)